MGNQSSRPAHRGAVEPEWRAELLERAPGIVRKHQDNPEPAVRFMAEWWRKEFVSVFGRDPLGAVLRVIDGGRA